MNLTEEPEIVDWPETHYVFFEKRGPFHIVAPEAWGDAHGAAPLLSENNTITRYMSLYRMNPNIYRAGFSLSAAPVKLPAEMSYEFFAGGKYSKFVLTGSYVNLGQATGRVWEIVSKTGIMVRPDYAIENYVNDPRNTPDDKLITEILVPTA